MYYYQRKNEKFKRCIDDIFIKNPSDIFDENIILNWTHVINNVIVEYWVTKGV